MSGEPLGPLLRRYRRGRDLTLEALAERSGVSDRTISDIERGASLGPQRRTVELLAAGLGLGEEERETLLAAARAGRYRPSDTVGGRAAPPRAVADFVGRERELEQLLGALDAPAGAPAPAVLVHGLPGLGKTTLAVHVASLLASSFEATLFVDLRGFDRTPVTPVGALVRLISALDPASGRVPRREADAVDTWQGLVAGRRLLVVLDNVASESQVRPLLPRVAPAAAIVTSRRPLPGLESVLRVPLAPLRAAESVELLRRIVPQAQLVEDVNADGGGDGGADETVTRLAALCADVPLALRITGNRLASRAGWSARDLVDRLAAEDRRIDGLKAGDLDLRATVAPSYEQLSPQARRAFRRLALLCAASFGDALVARALGAGSREAEDALDEITDLGLLQAAAQGRFELHDLLRLFARDRLLAEEDGETRRRLADDLRHWLLATTIDAGRWFEPEYETPPEEPDPLVDLSSAALAHAWLQTEAEHWFPAFQEAARAGEHRLVVDVAESLHWFSDRWMHWGHWHEVYAAGVAAARALGDDTVLATQLGYLSWAESKTRSDPATALDLAREAREVARRAGDQQQEAWALLYLSWAHEGVDELDEAWATAAEAVTVFAASGDRAGQLQALRNTAVLLLDLGRPTDSMAQERAVLDLLEESEAEVGRQVAGLTRMGSLIGIAKALVRLDRHPEALDFASRAIELERDLAITDFHVSALRVRARAARGLGRTEAARADLGVALDLCLAAGKAGKAAEVREELALLDGG